MARRVNRKFLIILTIIVVGGLGVLVVGARYLSHRNPARYEQAGDRLMKEGNYDLARTNYGQAYALDPKNPMILVKYGDAMEQMALSDPVYMGQDIGAWRHALEVDPGYVPALKRLLSAYEDIAELSPTASNFQTLRETAEKLSRLDHTDAHADATQHLATIEGWLAGLQTDTKTVEENLKAIEALHAKDPANADLPYYIAMVNLRRARDAALQNDQPGVDRLVEQTQKLFDAALKAQPQNAELHYRAFQVDQMMTQFQTPDAAKASMDRSRQQIEAAQKLVKPSDEFYVAINKAAADMLSRDGKRPEAEKILRATLAAHPADPAAQVALAEMLGTDDRTRPEAIALLTNPKRKDQADTRKEALLKRQYDVISRMTLVSLQIDAYADEADATKKKALLDQITAGTKKLTELIGQSPDVLKLTGRLQLAQGDDVKAIQTLEKVQQLLSQNGRQDFQVKYLLARAYLKVNQSGEAKKLLQQVIQKFPGMVEARMLLAQQLLKEHDVAGAEPQLAFLRKALPDSPQVKLLEIASLDPKTDEAKVQALYASLPDKTAKQSLDKARVAVQLGKKAEATRLLEGLVAKNPGDTGAVDLLGRLYVADNQKPKAVALVETALKSNPDDKSLELLRKIFSGASAKEIIESETDPLTRELNLAELAERSHDAKGALEHLQKAAAISPDSPRVLIGQFNYALATGHWDDAQKYADKLGATNQDQAGGKLFRFRLAMARKDYKQAEQIGGDLTSQMPEFAQSWVSLGQALQAQGRFNEALSKYLAALDRQSDNMDAIRGSTQCYLATNRPQAAHDTIVDALKQFPNSADLKEQLTQWQLTYGDPADALPAREGAVKDQPDNPNARTALAVAYLRVAQVMDDKTPGSGQSYISKARDVYEQAVKKWPDQSIFYARLADIDLTNNQPAAAEAVIKELAARPAWKDKPQPLLMLAQLYQREKQNDSAEKALRSAYAMAKDNFDVQSQLANFLAANGKLDEALAILPATSTDENVQKLRVELQVNGGRLADALTAINAQLAKDPQSASWRSLLGFVYMNSGKLADARSAFDQVLTNDPKNAAALYYRGLLKLRQTPPDVTGAIDDLSAARNVSGNNVAARLALADALSLNHDTDRAANELETALQIDPQSKAARMKLISLYSSANPPRWADADRVIAQSREISQLANDPDLLNQEAMVRLGEKRPAEALSAIELARKGAPNSAAITQNYLKILMANGKTQQVIQETGKLLVSHESWWLRVMRAEAQAKDGNTKAAMQDYDAALASVEADKNLEVAQSIIGSISDTLGPDRALAVAQKRAATDSRWNIDVAYLLYHQHRVPEARQAIGQVLSNLSGLNKSDRIGALRMAGIIYMLGHPPEYPKARDAYVKLLSESPNDLPALNNLACLLANNVTPPQPKEAKVYSTQAYNLMKQSGRWDPLVADTQGWVLALCGGDDLPQAVSILADVVDRHPFPEARYHLAEAYIKDNRLDEAKKQLDQATEALSLSQKNNQDVDPVLKVQIDQAQQRLREMRSKADAK